MHPVLEVRGLVNRFGSQVVHDGLDMEVNADEVFGIVGGSGSGKSVLLRTILGLQRPQAGTVCIDGRDITHLDAAQLRPIKERYGVAFQQGALFSGLTVLQNVQLPMIEHLSMRGAALDELALLKIRLVGLPPDAAQKYPSQLSGGMVKRVALARALVLEPELVFLDEPTAGLDPDRSEGFVKLIRELHDRLNFTVIMATHDLDTLVSVSDRIAVLADQRVVVCGSLKEVVASDHPFIRNFFLGERGLRALSAAPSLQT